MVSSIITLSFSTTGRWFTCIHDHPVDSAIYLMNNQGHCSKIIDLYDEHFKIMFRNKLYFTTKSYCICILNYLNMYNFNNECIDWLW